MKDWLFLAHIVTSWDHQKHHIVSLLSVWAAVTDMLRKHLLRTNLSVPIVPSTSPDNHRQRSP